MKAVVVRRFGGPDVLELADVSIPEPGPRQVRIAVKAAAVNPVDVATRAGWLLDAGLMVANGPVGIGWDVAGVVDCVGSDVRRFAPGDDVIGLRDLLSLPIGAQADTVVLDEDALAPAPRTVAMPEASTLPLNALTAVQALDLLDLDAGQWLLVTGAAGILGGFMLELATLRGLKTLAVAAPDDKPLAQNLGALEFVERGDNLGARVREVVPGGVDGVLDAAVIGVAALDAVRDGGSFVAVTAGSAPPPLRGTRVHNVWIRADGPRLAELSALVDAGRLTPRVADTLPLDAVATAHRRLEAGGVRGRIVLEPGG
jgi:NADPH:quinone reductase-like Zn-dependent oxidoreductase